MDEDGYPELLEAEDEDGLMIFDKLYWIFFLDNLCDLLQVWGVWMKGKLLVMGVALFASLMAGSICTFCMYHMLVWYGPVRLKKLRPPFLGLIIGSILITGSVDLAAACVLGTTVIFLLLFLQNSTGCHIKIGMPKSKKKEPPVFLAMEFWYVGKRVLWINVTKGYVGIHSL